MLLIKTASHEIVCCYRRRIGDATTDIIGLIEIELTIATLSIN